MVWKRTCLILLLACTSAQADNTTYYVSGSDGNDADSGLTPEAAFASVGRVNQLALGPGDRVLFRCGDTWRAEALVITDSGSAASPIVFGSNPQGCANRPVLSGSQPIAGWAPYSGNIWFADLGAGANAGRFPRGINQLFRGGRRLLYGRWPNLDTPDGGYSIVDGHSPANRRITDNQLPPGSWTGAAIHIKGIRWYMLNRDVTASSGTSLTLNEDVYCYTGNCVGWGYFINGHLRTLDREGEWFHDAAANRVYLVSSGGRPADGEVEGSVLLQAQDNSAYWGAIVLGRHLQEHIQNVVIENFTIRNWSAGGITTPTNLESDENVNLTIRNNVIENVEETGIRLATWVWNLGPNSGWRGGRGLQVLNNVIDGANHYGIDSYARNSRFAGNTIRNIALIANLNRSGMGCGVTGSNCTENGAGLRVKLDPGKGFSARNNTIEGNSIERVGMNGIDVFGPLNVLRNNFIREACFSKGDCGAVRLFGRDSFASTEVHDVDLTGNIIVNTIGNTDGCHSTFRTLFGFGLYIDNWSDAIDVSGNTVVGSTASGVLFQNSRGTLTNNTIYGNASGQWVGAQLNVVGSPSRVASQGNVFFGLGTTPTAMSVGDRQWMTASNSNTFFHPYAAGAIQAGGQTRTFEQWKSYSGLDAASKKNWFTLAPGAPRSWDVFLNPTGQSVTVPLGGRRYLDLDQQPVTGSLVLPAYGSRVLIRNGPASEFVPVGFGASLGSSPLALLAAARIARRRRVRRRPGSCRR
jgi:parallel beta-helix repeat protein